MSPPYDATPAKGEADEKTAAPRAMGTWQHKEPHHAKPVVIKPVSALLERSPE
jgi:hypothetical protein